MSKPPVTVVVPLKLIGEAKSRLGTVLTPLERRHLVLEMFRNVLTKALDSMASQVMVLTQDGLAGRLALEAGAVWVSDPAGELNRSLRFAFELCWKKGDTPLFLPADLPLLQTQHVDEILAEWRGEPKLVISPATDRGGTNALLLPVECPLELRFGIDSFQHHLTQASQKGYRSSVYINQDLGFDVDTPHDLRLYRTLSIVNGACR
jgi:2-phospho-L-lactate guanylyltransferase